MRLSRSTRHRFSRSPLGSSRGVHVEKRMESLGYPIVPPASPIANYSSYKRFGNTIYLSGHLPYQTDHFFDPKFLIKGKVGDAMTVEAGKEAAKNIALSMIGTLKHEVDDLDKVFGIVNCGESFTQHPQVVNGASHLFLEVFGPDKGSHARTAIGAPSLPLDAAVEIELVAHVEE